MDLLIRFFSITKMEKMLETEKVNDKKNNYLYTFISMIPVVSSALCAVYVVILYSDIQVLIKDFGAINSIVNNINTTKIENLVDGIITLENCILSKLPICHN